MSLDRWSNNPVDELVEFVVAVEVVVGESGSLVVIREVKGNNNLEELDSIIVIFLS